MSVFRMYERARFQIENKPAELAHPLEEARRLLKARFKWIQDPE
jgi:hypothetical protein